MHILDFLNLKNVCQNFSHRLLWCRKGKRPYPKNRKGTQLVCVTDFSLGSTRVLLICLPCPWVHVAAAYISMGMQ
jgi:hypothetical protein